MTRTRAARTRPDGGREDPPRGVPKTPLGQSLDFSVGAGRCASRGGHPMRFEGRRVLTPGRRNGVAVAVATVLLLGAIWPANAAVPIVEGAVGEAAGLALFQPFDAGYTDVSVSSSNADVVRVGRIE